MLCSGGLLLRSWHALGDESQGYTADGVAASEQHLWTRHRTPEARVSFSRDVIDQLSAMPGVEAAAIATALPIAPSIGSEEADVRVPGASTPVPIHAISATPGLFGSLRMALLSGRDFSSIDAAASEPTVILSASAAQRFF